MGTQRDPSYIRQVLSVVEDRCRTFYSGLAEDWFSWKAERALDDLANDPEVEKYFASLYDEELPQCEEEEHAKELAGLTKAGKAEKERK